MKRKYCIIIIIMLFLGSFLFFIKIPETEKEAEVDLKHKRFKDLGITSTKSPFNTHLFWEHATYGLFMVDSTDQTVLLFSTKARLLVDGSDWDVVDLSDNTNSYKIQSGWLDGNDLWLVMCDNDGTADDFEVCFVELDDSNDCNPVGVSAGADVNTVYAYDIFKIGTDMFVLDSEIIGAQAQAIIWEVDTAPFVSQDSHNFGDQPTSHFLYGIVTGNFYYTFLREPPSLNAVFLLQYNDAITTIALRFDGSSAGYFIKAFGNTSGLAYDGNDIFTFVGESAGDGKNYLISYSFTANKFTIGGEYNIALMLDRNTASGVLEKAFSIDSTETVYEITAKRSGIRVLQDMSAITDAVIIAITDNFLMNDDGDMFEFTDVTKEISTISYNDGIIGIQKRGRFTVHPDFHANWSIGDSIKIYDDNDVLEFHGLIIDKNRNRRGIYIFKIDSFTNEIYRKTYNKSYSADDTDTKQKDIIDNGCDFCYRSSSIVGTTTTYDYVYNRAIIYLFWLARFLERQVPYIEPDGKIWTKAHDGLAKNAMIYGATYNFKDEVDGTSGADIDWVTSVFTNTVEIVSDWQSHRKVLKCTSTGGGSVYRINHQFTAQADGTIEFFFGTPDATDAHIIHLTIGTGLGGGNIVTTIYSLNDVLFATHGNGVGGTTTVNCGAIIDDQIAHIRWFFDSVTDTISMWRDGINYIDGENFVNDNTFTASQISYIILLGPNIVGATAYFDAFGESWDPAYNVGDNEVAWDIVNHWQEVSLIDIPSLEEIVQGFFDGNSGVTRNTIRYKNNATTVRPVAATRDPIEQLQGILPLNEFRDPKLKAVTEANQLGDNRYDIWSSDTIFLGLRIEGQGYLQPGKTVEIKNTGQITIAKKDYLVLSFERDPKNDVYVGMILSDNIIFPREFSNLQNTTTTQVHTASVQAIENQAAIATGGVTPPIGVKMDYFGTGIKGTITTRDYEISVANGDDFDMLGWFVANGQASTPNCIDKFVRNEATSGVAGGSDDAIVVSHVHEVHITGGEGATDKLDVTASFGTQVGFNTQSAGVSSVGKNIPAKISAIPIIRMS